MKLKGRITFQIDREETRMKIEDENANITFCKIKLTPTQTIDLLSRLGSVECELEVNGIEKIGKTHENMNFEFEATHGVSQRALSAACGTALFNQYMKEWISDDYYNSSNTLFKKDGVQWARTTIRRWS